MKLSSKINKILSLNLIACVSFASIFPLNVSATSNFTAFVNSNDVRFRSKPTTEKENGVSNIITEIDMGGVINVLSSTKVSGPGCNDGWYNIEYQGTKGYICSTYVSTSWNDPYLRPWTSPKKAIMGGALFISSSYISKGQFTSYLKKFNVNPNSYYSQYNHQYQANLAAPSSEASTSWSTYSKNNLASLPLSFSIPVYNNMAEEYNRPTGNLITIEKQTEITDKAFEDYLDKEKFPESYKPALRSLHTKHPNWTFKAMFTNVNFNEAVLVEKNVSSIQGNNALFDYSNGSAVQTEKGWYLANDATVAYYLDPRNFLTEKYILQFESLEYSDNYTENVVKSVLANSFMSDISLIDNQSYASIFVEAGKNANVSAVYLASLAIQESGREISNSTSGDNFDYEGTTYGGLFNFFNIGAYSSASSPLKAGLVYASGGFCTTCSNNINYSSQSNQNNSSSNSQTNSNISTPPVVVKTLSNYISEAGFKINNNYVNGFTIGQTATDVASKLKNSSIVIDSSSGLMGTGTTIKLNNDVYYVVLYGDLTGDGKINSADLLKLRQHLQGTIKLDGAYFRAGALVNGNSINSADLLKLRQFLLGTNSISQS